eukprot:COSAG02_NODE_57982_length_279_cov_0.500000_1_plen_51_part_00
MVAVSLKKRYARVGWVVRVNEELMGLGVGVGVVVVFGERNSVGVGVAEVL